MVLPLDNLGVETDETLVGANSQTNPDNEDGSEQQPDPAVAKRHAEQMAGAKQEVERTRNIAVDMAKKAAKEDASTLLELHRQNPKMAEQVALSFGYSSFAHAKSVIGAGQEGSGVETQPEDFDTAYERRRAAEKHQEAIEEAGEYIAKLDPSMQTNAQLYFDKLAEGKVLDRKTALQFAEMAVLYVTKDKSNAKTFNDNVAKVSSNGLTNTKKAPAKTDGLSNMVLRGGKLVDLSSNNS